MDALYGPERRSGIVTVEVAASARLGDLDPTRERITMGTSSGNGALRRTATAGCITARSRPHSDRLPTTPYLLSAVTGEPHSPPASSSSSLTSPSRSRLRRRSVLFRLSYGFR